MNHSILISSLLAALSLAACDKPTVVNTPPVVVAVPGPAGPQGATGSQGSQGTEGMKGETGKPGSGTTVVLVPPMASAPTN